MLACQPCTDYLLPVNGSSLRTPLTLTDSLPCCDLVLSSTTSFLSTSGKKRGKETPQGTNGSLTSLRGRHALGRVRFRHANWPLHLSGAKCGIDFPLTRSAAYPCKRQRLLLLSRFPYRLSSFEPRDDRAVFFIQKTGCLNGIRSAVCQSGTGHSPHRGQKSFGSCGTWLWRESGRAR